MADLFWPGDHRAGDLFTDAAFLAAMLRTEQAWLSALHAHGLADTLPDLTKLLSPDDVPELAEEAEDGGNPVIPMLAVLRERADPAVKDRIHAGLTSQDVLDTALALCVRDTVTRLNDDLATLVTTLSTLAGQHRDTPLAGRTLTQHAIPITFGLKVAGWLQGVLDAKDRLAHAELPIQIGGAAGSLAAPVALAGSVQKAGDLIQAAAAELDIPVRPPWHTSRGAVTLTGDALTGCTDAMGRIANDVLVGARPEIHELVDGGSAGRGGSSAMPNKQNPVLAVLVHRAAIAAPPLSATLHAAAAGVVDERPDGAWHVEWATLRTLARRTVVAVSQTAELCADLRVDVERMAATLTAARPGIDAEQRKYQVAGPYRGANDAIIDAILKRAGDR